VSVCVCVRVELALKMWSPWPNVDMFYLRGLAYL
jgi:hypothetical protein